MQGHLLDGDDPGGCPPGVVSQIPVCGFTRVAPQVGPPPAETSEKLKSNGGGEEG